MLEINFKVVGHREAKTNRRMISQTNCNVGMMKFKNPAVIKLTPLILRTRPDLDDSVIVIPPVVSNLLCTTAARRAYRGRTSAREHDGFGANCLDWSYGFSQNLWLRQSSLGASNRGPDLFSAGNREL